MAPSWVKESEPRIVSGVLASLALDWGTSPWIVRTVYVVLTLATGILPGVLIYLLLSLFME